MHDLAVNRNDEARDVAIQADGKIVVAGYALTETFSIVSDNFAVVRYMGDPTTLVSPRTPFDYDGDGRADLSVFRPSAGSWYISNSSNNAFLATQSGASGDLIALADFDGDGKTDICVFRPSDGGWYRLNSSNNTFTPAQFGTNGDLPVPGDFDGDGKADLVVFRPSSGIWYLLRTTAGFTGVQFGANGDIPTPNAFVR